MKKVEPYENNDKFPFHSTSRPRGLKYYNPNVLTRSQQKKLNNIKLNLIVDNEEYLKNHPEIRAIVILLLTEVFKYRLYGKDTIDALLNFFKRSKYDIQSDIDAYLHKKGVVRPPSSAGSKETIPDKSSLKRTSLYSYKSYKSISCKSDEIISDDTVSDAAIVSEIDEPTSSHRSDLIKYFKSVDVGENETSTKSTRDFYPQGSKSSYDYTDIDIDTYHSDLLKIYKSDYDYGDDEETGGDREETSGDETGENEEDTIKPDEDFQEIYGEEEKNYEEYKKRVGKIYKRKRGKKRYEDRDEEGDEAEEGEGDEMEDFEGDEMGDEMEDDEGDAEGDEDGDEKTKEEDKSEDEKEEIYDYTHCIC